MMQRARPPFRADHVGSLLRPQRVRDARARFAKGEIEAAELQRIESLEISTAVQRQKQNGLRLATDGEFRRAWWHFDFLKALAGCEIQKTQGAVVAGRVTSGESVHVTGKLDFPPTIR
jgi:5-methyltetrahydropteroyltriglutamate--homocysteine methyltransferase